MRGDMATQEFAALIAPVFQRSLPKLGTVQENVNQEVDTNDVTL